jgi:hypothetical protein
MVCSNCRLQFADCVQHFGLDWKIYGLSQMVAESLAGDGDAGGVQPAKEG